MAAIKAIPIFVSLVCFVVNKIGLQIETFNHENHQIHEMSLRAIFFEPKKMILCVTNHIHPQSGF